MEGTVGTLLEDLQRFVSVRRVGRPLPDRRALPLEQEWRYRIVGCAVLA
jgi:hypothetical protein